MRNAFDAEREKCFDEEGRGWIGRPLVLRIVKVREGQLGGERGRGALLIFRASEAKKFCVGQV